MVEDREQSVEVQTGADSVLYDARTLQRLREIDPSGVFLCRWIQLFLAEAPQKVTDMQVAIDAGIAQPLVRGAHSLKSYAGWLGSQPLWQLCHRLEQEARAGALAECRQLMPDLRRQLSLFQEWLTGYLQAQA